MDRQPPTAPPHAVATVGSAASDDDFALSRLLAAIKQCGFEEVIFEYEPVAAAYSCERALEKDELILIGDFGPGKITGGRERTSVAAGLALRAAEEWPEAAAA